MNAIKLISGALVTAMISGCASMDGANGPRGPRLVSGGYSTGHEQYAEIGLEFSSMGDFVAMVSPSRWKNPIETGGSLSWINPVAWSDDAGQTGRILLGEAVIVGGAAAAIVMGSDSGGSDSSSAATGGPTTPGTNPGGPPGT